MKENKTKIKKIIKKSLRLVKAPFVIRDYLKYKSLDKDKRFTIKIFDFLPALFEKTSMTRFDTHYIYHPAWAARKVLEINPTKHIDISSTLHFCSILSAFMPVEFYDYRPANLNLSNLESKFADLNNLPFIDNSVESISCMHTIEHIGLGRYGDNMDPDGDLKAIHELIRVTQKGGHIIFVTPIGRPRIEFNGHRIYSYDMIIQHFAGLKLIEFSLVPDNALESGFIYNASKEQSDEQSYGCGCFVFQKI
jgi:SAM-dependent methyltransferase